MKPKQAKIDTLISAGWYQWYNPDYWSHEKCAPQGSDCTYYGLSLDEAYLYETDKDYQRKIKQAQEFGKAIMQAASNLSLKKEPTP